MNNLIDKILDRISERASVLFRAYKWKWYRPSPRHIPSRPEIKNTLISLLSDLDREEGSFVSTGRLMVLREDVGIGIYLNIGWIPSSSSKEELDKILEEMREENGVQ
jgi:hypothetical protein